MEETSFDIMIIGSGPGGYVTAIRAAQLDFKTRSARTRALALIGVHMVGSEVTELIHLSSPIVKL